MTAFRHLLTFNCSIMLEKTLGILFFLKQPQNYQAAPWLFTYV